MVAQVILVGLADVGCLLGKAGSQLLIPVESDVVVVLLVVIDELPEAQRNVWRDGMAVVLSLL